MTIVNGGFEDQATGAQPGLPDGWTTSETYTAEEYAEFTVLIIPAGTRTSGQDGFEGEWPNGFSDGLIPGFIAYFDDIDPAFFDPTSPQSFEDFETIWGTAPWGVTDFWDLTPQHAVFADGGSGPGADATEESWEYDANGDELKVFSLHAGNLEFAEFDTTDEEHEDFEEQWDNDDYNWSFPAAGTGAPAELEFSIFATSFVSLGDEEPFQGVLFDLEGVVANAGSDTFTKTSHGLENSWPITFYNLGGRLPDGLLANTRYFVVNKTTHTFQVSAVAAGSPVNLIDVGFGTHYVKHNTSDWWTEELEGV